LKFHAHFSFSVASRWVDPGTARLKKGKKAPGEKLPALIPLPDDAESGTVLAALARRNCRLPIFLKQERNYAGQPFPTSVH
jgi:hypothetical protein